VFNYVMKSADRKLPEHIARFFFQQFIEGLGAHPFPVLVLLTPPVLRPHSRGQTRYRAPLRESQRLPRVRCLPINA
jgi:hypothetical protein